MEDTGAETGGGRRTGVPNAGVSIDRVLGALETSGASRLARPHCHPAWALRIIIDSEITAWSYALS